VADQTPTAEAIDIALNMIAEDEALPRSLWIIANPKATDPYDSMLLPHQEPIQQEGPPLARFIAEEFGFDQWARTEVYSDASITRETQESLSYSQSFSVRASRGCPPYSAQPYM
jgi:hypothetical protein